MSTHIVAPCPGLCGWHGDGERVQFGFSTSCQCISRCRWPPEVTGCKRGAGQITVTQSLWLCHRDLRPPSRLQGAPEIFASFIASCVRICPLLAFLRLSTCQRRHSRSIHSIRNDKSPAFSIPYTWEPRHLPLRSPRTRATTTVVLPDLTESSYKSILRKFTSAHIHRKCTAELQSPY